MTALLIFVIIAGVYYWPGKEFLFRYFGRPLGDRLGTGRSTVVSSRNFGELIVASISHVMLAIAMLLMWKVRLSSFAFPGFGTLILGAALGASEMALGSLVCRVVISIVNRQGGFTASLDQWIAISKGGWLQHHVGGLAAAPLGVSLLFTALQISAEEVIFRAVLAAVIGSIIGPLGVVGISTALFCGMQMFHTASWRNAIFPVFGALVMGPIHMYLFLAVPNIWPLVVAHIV